MKTKVTNINEKKRKRNKKIFSEVKKRGKIFCGRMMRKKNGEN